jgi:hypothetical protein
MILSELKDFDDDGSFGFDTCEPKEQQIVSKTIIKRKIV